MRAALLAMTVLFVTLGCAPRLADGVFTCPDRVCPSGLICAPDGFCRRMGVPDGGAGLDVGMPPPDGGMPPDAPRPPLDGLLPDFATCVRGAECAGGLCYRGYMDGWPVGYCTTPCVSSACAARAGLDVDCEHPSEICRLFCGTSSTCPPDYACALLGRVDFGECVPPGTPIERVMPDSCTGDSGCWPGICAMLPGRPTGECVRPCGPAFACATGQRCGPSLDRGDVCLP